MIPCTLRQLEVFLAAAHDCHFARTASRLGISQPAISAHISALEEQLGKKLFVRRKGACPLLSDHGVALLREANALSSVGTNIRSFAASGMDRAGAASGIVRVCAGQHLLMTVKQRLRAFHERQPAVTLECQYAGPPEKGAQLVKANKADLSLYTVGEPAAYGLHTEVLRPVRFGLYAASGFLSYQHASPEEISALPFILPIEGSPLDDMVQKALVNAGILCTKIVARVQYWEVILEMAKAGHGVAALFETMLTTNDRRALVTFDIELPTLYRTIFRRFDRPSPAVRAAESFLRETAVH